MWQLNPSEEYLKRCKDKDWSKKHSREFKAVHDNLDTFLKVLNFGTHPQNAKFGFIHPEPSGALAIDQKGGGSGLKQTRLYVYPQPSMHVLHVITLGDKNTQKQDIETCKDFIRGLSPDHDPSIQTKEAHDHPNHGPKAAVIFQRKRNA
jgi:hypothetical protein